MRKSIISLAVAASLAHASSLSMGASLYAVKETPKSRTFKSNTKRYGTASAKRRAKKKRNIKRSKK